MGVGRDLLTSSEEQHGKRTGMGGACTLKRPLVPVYRPHSNLAAIERWAGQGTA